MKVSQFFRIAVEGGTTDGRTIDRAMIEDSVATFGRENYTPRINCEHIHGFSPEPPFNAYGSVAALKAETIEQTLDGKTETKLALFAKLEPNEQLLAVNAKDQKIFTSCEFAPNYGGTGKWGLTGLAVTDSPASLGTEMLKFCAGQGDASPLATRKQDKSNLFTAALEAPKLELSEGSAPDTSNDAVTAAATEAKGFFRAMKAMFAAPSDSSSAGTSIDPSPASGSQSGGASAPSDKGASNPDTQLGAMMAQGFEKLSGLIAEQGQQLSTRIDKVAADHQALSDTIENTPGTGQPPRPLSDGGNAKDKFTYC